MCIRDRKNSRQLFPDSENLNSWIEEGLNCDELSYTEYTFADFQENHNLEFLEKKQLNQIVNLINIYEDYLGQVHEDRKTFRKENRELFRLWEFYYNEILFKQIEQEKKIESNKAFPNSEALKREYNDLIMDFESKFVLI